MKKAAILIPFLLAMFIGVPELLAQEVEKSEILNAMNSFDDLDISADKKDKLKESNKSAVDNLFDIAKGNDTPEEKTMKFKMAKEDNAKIFKDILGEDDFKKYKKTVKKKLKPFKRKAKLVGFLL
ncbi:hypothetical protein IFO69_09580 [Echinicola sp. CAU 1574]|uniref:Uncharacterized protein n=1 Tax=Echinicola arenosa TaxID=2774144 RepID=A0ABR9AKC0_9BACT|nr:hypothetical protein [Echinicola arenosa]MBD8488994.1 hypothetical protein [Echinicola arenosa]